MAITATLALTPTSGTAQCAISIAMTITNGATTAVTVTGVQPFAFTSGTNQPVPGVLLGLPPYGPGMNVTVPGSGTLVMSWNAIINGPSELSTLYPAPQQLIDFGAIINTKDGQYVPATVATFTSNPIVLP